MRRRGYTLLEVLIAMTLFSVIFMASITLIEHERRLSRSVLHISQVELMSQDMMFRLKRELASAFGENPIAVAPLGLGQGSTTLQLDSSLGFPPSGTLLIDRGQGQVERLSYAGLDATQTLLLNLSRAEQCTSDVAHGVQAEVLWGGLAEPLAQQSPPPDPEDYDGICLEATGPVYYRGDGSGFSYRVPVDPSGGQDYLNGGELQWGAQLPGTGQTLDGWIAIYFRASSLFDESTHGDDINGDGDRTDVFDVGQIRKVIWDVTDPSAPVHELGLGPSNVIQERCAYGSDLDADGFNDPIFLWDKTTNELNARLFLLGATIANSPVTRKIEEVMFLRNEPEL